MATSLQVQSSTVYPGDRAVIVVVDTNTGATDTVTILQSVVGGALFDNFDVLLRFAKDVLTAANNISALGGTPQVDTGAQ